MEKVTHTRMNEIGLQDEIDTIKYMIKVLTITEKFLAIPNLNDNQVNLIEKHLLKIASNAHNLYMNFLTKKY